MICIGGTARFSPRLTCGGLASVRRKLPGLSHFIADRQSDGVGLQALEWRPDIYQESGCASS